MHYIVDGNFIYRKCYSLNHNNYLNDIQRCIDKIDPTINGIFIVFDSNSWRSDEYDDYKHKLTRPPAPENLWDTYDQFIEDAKNASFVVLREKGFEGDDLMYLLTTVIDGPVCILSGDHDVHQLISDHVIVYNTLANGYITSNRNIKHSLPVRVVNPTRFLLKKIVIGDRGDNIPGIKKGFGTKTYDKIFKYTTIPPVLTTSSITNYIQRQFREDLTEKIKNNIRMMWLDYEVYPTPIRIQFDSCILRLRNDNLLS